MDKNPYQQQPPPPGFMAPPPYSQVNAPPNYPPNPNPGAVPATNIIIVQNQPLGPDPQRITCPHCHAEITTRTEVEPNTKTFIFSFLLCLTFLWPCACIPCCIDDCQTKKHYCPNCRAYLGAYDH